MAYSNDLRKRAVEYFLQNTKRYQEVAGLFRVAVGTLHHWVNEYTSTGALEPRKSTGRHRIIKETQHQVLREFVGKNADNSLTVLAEKWRTEYGQEVNISTMGRSMARAGLTYKKNSSRYGT